MNTSKIIFWGAIAALVWYVLSIAKDFFGVNIPASLRQFYNNLALAKDREQSTTESNIEARPAPTSYGSSYGYGLVGVSPFALRGLLQPDVSSDPVTYGTLFPVKRDAIIPLNTPTRNGWINDAGQFVSYPLN